MADGVIRDLDKKGRSIFVVGGAGLYIKALTRGLFRVREGDGAVRERLKAEAKTPGAGGLYQRLQRVDPVGAKRIHPGDTYRIIRALEGFEITGTPISEHQRSHGFLDTPYRVLKIGLSLDRKILYNRINDRVDLMLASGLLEEVKGLLDQGYGPELKPMRSIGYRHMIDYLKGVIRWDETARLFKRDTRRYAKRQLTWFKADPEIYWAEPARIRDIRSKIGAFLRH